MDMVKLHHNVLVILNIQKHTKGESHKYAKRFAGTVAQMYVSLLYMLKYVMFEVEDFSATISIITFTQPHRYPRRDLD